MRIFSEIGIGNKTLCSTEFEKGRFEHRIKRFIIPPQINGYYIRIWIGTKEKQEKI